MMTNLRPVLVVLALAMACSRRQEPSPSHEPATTLPAIEYSRSFRLLARCWRRFDRLRRLVR